MSEPEACALYTLKSAQAEGMDHLMKVCTRPTLVAYGFCGTMWLTCPALKDDVVVVCDAGGGTVVSAQLAHIKDISAVTIVLRS